MYTLSNKKNIIFFFSISLVCISLCPKSFHSNIRTQCKGEILLHAVKPTPFPPLISFLLF